MNNQDSRIDAIFSAGDARSEKLRAFLVGPEDLISLVLRGHLVLEELLFAACAAYCRDAEQLKNARLRFPQLVSLLRALEKISAVPSHYWDALLELNSLRNGLAHKLEHKDLQSRIARFVGIVASNGKTGMKFPQPYSSREALESALNFLVGGLEVVSVWHAAVEELIRQRATQSEA
jgi:hypothetical protein